MSESKKLPPIEMRALRRAEGGTYERLLCQLLIQANSAEGLRKIEKMCQAYYRAKSMLPQNPVKMDENDVEVISKVVVALRHPTYYSVDSGHRYIVVSWPFAPTQENFEDVELFCSIFFSKLLFKS